MDSNLINPLLRVVYVTTTVWSMKPDKELCIMKEDSKQSKNGSQNHFKMESEGCKANRATHIYIQIEL